MAAAIPLLDGEGCGGVGCGEGGGGGAGVQVAGVQVEMALQWTSDSFTDSMVGFVNSIKTIDGGTHIDVPHPPHPPPPPHTCAHILLIGAVIQPFVHLSSHVPEWQPLQVLRRAPCTFCQPALCFIPALYERAQATESDVCASARLVRAANFT